MVYVPKNWQDGVNDPVNAANLNHIEQGIKTLDDTLAAGVGAQLAFKGDWAAGNYVDGDVVVKDGVEFLCVGGPTAVPPDASLWGGLAPPGSMPPAVVDGKWLKGVAGAMVWSDIASDDILTGRLARDAQVVTDWNNANFNGFWRSVPAAANAPNATDYFMGITTRYDLDNIVQEVWPLFAQAAGLPAVKYQRRGTTGSWGPWRMLSGVIARNTTAATVGANVVTENNLAALTIPAGALGANGIARMVINGTFRSQSTSDNTITYTLYLGGTVVWRSTGQTYNNGSGTPDGELFAEFFVQALGATNLQAVYGKIGANRDTGGAQIGVGKVTGSQLAAVGNGSVDVAKDMTVDQVLALNVAMSSGNANNFARHRSSFLEIL